MSMKDVSGQLTDPNSKLESLDTSLSVKLEDLRTGLSAKIDALSRKFDEGFNASKVRDEELVRLRRFGLEADEALGDAMNRRFDEAGQKHQEQMDLLREVQKNRVTGR